MPARNPAQPATSVPAHGECASSVGSVLKKIVASIPTSGLASQRPSRYTKNSAIGGNTNIASRRPSRPPANIAEARPRSQGVSRLIVKLRGHGFIAKIPRARRYRVTRYGHRVMTAAITLHDDQFADNYQAAA